MATVFVDAALGDDARSYAQAQSAATPWATPYRVNSAATAADTASIVSGIYNADGSAAYGTNTFHSFSKAIIYDAANDGGVVFRNTGTTNPVGNISGSLANGSVLTFDGIVFDAQSATQQCFANSDMVANAWTVSWTDCSFINPTTRCLLLSALKIGTFTTTRCTFSGSPSSNGVEGSAGTLAASGAVSVTHNYPIFDLTRNGTVFGITQDASAAVGTLTYAVNNPSGTVETTSAASAAAGVYLRCPGASVNGYSTSPLTIISPAASSSECFGVYLYPNAVNMPDVSIKNTWGEFDCPAGHAASFGNSTTVAAGTQTGGEVSGNNWRGRYFASGTPHGITVGRATSIATHSGNTLREFYIGFLASRTTSGTGRGNVARDNYGADFYAKGCTAWTWEGNTAIQTGKYARRNLAPFSIDSQGGTTTTATTFNANTFICSEADFTRVGALANITVNNSGTMTNNTYIVPDTWDTDTTDRFFVGGSEGGRAGATGYTIDEWITGTAGSVSATNGTGTISISGDKVIRMPIAQINALIAGGSALYRRRR